MSATGDRVRVRIDGEQLDYLTNHNLGFGKFVALNEEEPKDEIQIGGIFRDQAVATEGLFKFGTIIEKQTMAELAPSVKKIPANATIDEFQTFLGIYDQGTQDLGYFTREPGIYTNGFEIPFPEGIERIRLRSFSWTLYPPSIYAGLAVRWNANQDFEMSVAGIDGQEAFVPVGDAGGDMDLNTAIAGKWLIPEQSAMIFARTAFLAYQCRMSGAIGQQKYGDRIVATPVLDDVTLTYYLPSAQVLVSENLD
jgi:hypothetical protein